LAAHNIHVVKDDYTKQAKQGVTEND
jgi:hypothetical protein